jgi:hypothetical protein
MMNHSNPTIQVVRESNNLAAVKVIMPIWHKLGADGITHVKMPLLSLSTYGKGEDDVEVAIKETLTCFCLGADKFGIGLESELEFNGWEKMSEHAGESIFIWKHEDSVDEILETGEETAMEVSIPQNRIEDEDLIVA